MPELAPTRLRHLWPVGAIATALLTLFLAVSASAAAPRTIVLQPGDEIRIANYDWRCVSVNSGGAVEVTCWPLDSTDGPLVYLSSNEPFFEIGSGKAPKLSGYLRSPRIYTYAFAFGKHVKLPFNVGETRDLVLQPGDSLRFAGIPLWTCQSTIRTPNFGCARQTPGGVTRNPILELDGGRVLSVSNAKPPVLQSLIAGSRL